MIPRQSQSTSDPGSAKSPSEDKICRRFLWGICKKHGQCNFRHELDIEKMKDIIKFCHDYQNRNGCTRKNCQYLHATKEEQTLFLAKGQVPRVLAERHAAMASAAANMTNAETIPQIAMFISESLMTQPPPAPWPPLPPSQAVLPPMVTAPPPPPVSPSRHVLALQPNPQAQQPPPLPAQTPVPASPSVGQIHPASTTYAGPIQIPLNHPPPMVPTNFDASRPPPPIPSNISNSQHLKRKKDEHNIAGASKIRKPEGSEISESLCESCVQRELRIDGFKLQLECLHSEEETQILLYKKKLQEYELGREILKSLVGPDLFRLFDDLIEGAQTPQDSLTSINSSTSFMSGSSAVPMQALLQLFEMFLSGGQRNVLEPVPSTSRVDESLQLQLTSLSRRLNVSNYTNPTPDLVKLVIETLRNGSVPERCHEVPCVEVRPNEAPDMRVSNSRTNGLSHAANGPKSQELARYGVAATHEYGARAPQAGPSYSVAGPSGFAGTPAPAPPPPAGYPMYHPAIPPPPNRHYYAQPPPAPNAPLYRGGDRAAAPGPPGLQPPTSSAAVRPTQPNAPSYTYMGRYPQQPYFPPYQ